MKVDVFNKVLKIPIHVLHPPSVIHSDMVYDHTRQDSTERTSNLVDCNFIIRMLYLNAY